MFAPPRRAAFQSHRGLVQGRPAAGAIVCLDPTRRTESGDGDALAAERSLCLDHSDELIRLRFFSSSQGQSQLRNPGLFRTSLCQATIDTV